MARLNKAGPVDITSVEEVLVDTVGTDLLCDRECRRLNEDSLCDDIEVSLQRFVDRFVLSFFPNTRREYCWTN
jgi:hypothetical protein